MFQRLNPSRSDAMSYFVDRYAIALILTLSAAMLAVFSGFNADDAYIVGRYAANAAAGHGLVYNHGDYVSALTSPLHAVFETGLAMLGMEPVAAYRVLAPIILAVCLVVAAKNAKFSRIETLFFCAFAVASPFLLIWSVGGLETPLLTAWVTLFVVAFRQFSGPNNISDRALISMGILIGLAFLTRHDSIVVLGPLYFGVFVQTYHRRALWIGLTTGAALCLGWLGFAWAYYGDLLPTSAYLKLFQADRSVDWHIASTVNFFVVSGLIIIVPLAFLGKPRTHGIAFNSTVILVSVSAGLFYALKTSGAHMFFSYRAFVPYLPAISILLMPAVRQFARSTIGIALIANVAAFVSMTSIGLTPVYVRVLPLVGGLPVEYSARTHWDYQAMQSALRQDAREIRQHWRDNGTGSPTIFLYTGGMGYWLPEFHVFEALVDFRKDCPDAMSHKLGAAHYVQDLGSVHVNPQIQETFRNAKENSLVGPISASVVVIDGPTDLRYWFAPTATPFRFPVRLNAHCNL